MPNFALIVEGHGDEMAFPSLLAKTGKLFGVMAYSPRPIRAGGYEKLLRDGQIERFVALAASREDADTILVAVDLDDGCPVEAKATLQERAESEAARSGKPVEICFCIREYEGWFLHNLTDLKNSIKDLDWSDDVSCPNPDNVRGAKEKMSEYLNEKYKETQHQILLTKSLNLKSLYATSRSYRRFCRAVTQMSYEEMEFIINEEA